MRVLDKVFYYYRFRTTCVWGDPARLFIRDKTNLANTLFNTESGHITIGDNVIISHDVALITGSHDINQKGKSRKNTHPLKGNDIVIEDGVWIGARCTILGNVRIGRNSVVAAGSVVIRNVPANVVVAGVPARVVKDINE